MSDQKNIRVAVASDQPVYLRGLVSLIMSLKNLQLVGQARDRLEVEQLCQMVQPDVLLLDLKALSDQGSELVRSIHQKCSHLKVVLLFSSAQETQMPEDFDSGRVYFFSKDLTEDEFASAIADINNSQPAHAREYLPAEPAPQIVEQDARSISASHGGRELERDVRDQELQMAGRIQAGILPEKAPSIPGWEISAGLQSARETSGDFYDFIPFSGQQWGIVIADVTDKGIGAALFMALSSTLIRTFAVRYPTLPALTMDIVNERIMTDTRGSLFVTAIYGVLEPNLGRLRFANAGHPPGLLFSSWKGKLVEHLRPTGMALGLLENVHWRQKVIKFMPGDVLLLYTDGITEAENDRGQVFGEDRLTAVLRANRGKTAQAIQNAVLAEVRRFAGESSTQDDIALIVVRRLSP
jgi:serine phosphatase RsbU (regulator of sigma subunit)